MWGTVLLTTVVVVESPKSSFKVLKVQRNNVLHYTTGTAGVIVGRIFELDNKDARKP